MLYRKNCEECDDEISVGVSIFSTDKFLISLCKSCQDWFEIIRNTSTEETISLYFALKERGVPAKIEKYDGYKTIDIAVPEAKMNIEIDGMHHNFDARQALSDLQRTYYSLKKGYNTVRIPNSLIRISLDQTADLVTEIINENSRQHQR